MKSYGILNEMTHNAQLREEYIKFLNKSRLAGRHFLGDQKLQYYGFDKKGNAHCSSSQKDFNEIITLHERKSRKQKFYIDL